MSYLRHIHAIDTHTECDPTRLVLSGIPSIKGNTMAEKRDNFIKNYDHIRKFLIHEPRGHKDMFGALITEPSDDSCLFGMIFMDADGYLDLCGHGIIAGVSVGFKTGMIPLDAASSPINVDTPAGLVKAFPRIEDNELQDVEIEAVESFCYKTGYQVKVEDGKTIPVDIAYGGNFFAFAQSSDIGIDVKKENLTELTRVAMTIKKEINENLDLIMPDGSKKVLDLVEIVDKPSMPEAKCKNILVYGDGQVGRDPCATGLCAKMAIEHHKGNLKENEDYVYEGILGTVYRGRIKEVTESGNAIVPIIAGRTFIVGFLNFVLESGDPLSDWLL